MASRIIPSSDGAIVTRADLHLQLDQDVQAFLDRCGENRVHAPALSAGNAGAVRPQPTQFRPRGVGEAALPVLLYLQDPASAPFDRHEAMQDLADLSGIAILLHDITDVAPAAVDESIADVLDSLTTERGRGLDPERLALGGDGIGALAAAGFASRAVARRFHLTLLVLATPVLGASIRQRGNHWLSMAQAEAQVAQADASIGADGWPSDYTRARLLGLPATLILTADADPFCETAEDFARRLMANELDVTASRAIGTIHDFTWLPPLLGSTASLGAQHLMARSLREHLSPFSQETAAC